MRVINAPVDFRVAIEFNKEEADALLAVCERIGGDVHKSDRRHFDALAEILRGAGASSSGVVFDPDRCRRDGLYFK
jgi:hypothetical protein